MARESLAWANGAPNHGWAFLPNGTSGVEVASFESGAGAPVLILEQVGDFDDSTWNSGTGQFGYGEDDETIVLDNGQGGGNCTGRSPCRITYLFGTTFEVTEIPDELIAEIMYDDAVKLYLNGVEVLLGLGLAVLAASRRRRH